MRNVKHQRFTSPTFIKENCQYNSNVHQEFDFEEGLIDEFTDICFVPAIMPPKDNYETHETNNENFKNVTNSLQNLENCIIELKTKKKEDFENDKKKSIFESLFCNSPQKKNGTKSVNISNCVSSRFEVNTQVHLFKKKEKIKYLKEQLENVVMKECTFFPNTHTKLKKDKISKRNLKEFLKNQTEYMNKVQKKKEQLKKETEQNNQIEECFHPKINKNITNISKNKKHAYERLYQLNETRSFNQQSKIKEQQKQTISHEKLSTQTTKRNIITPSLLYEDAERRHKVAKNIEKAKNCIESMDKSQILQNKKSEKYVSQKFIKEFCQVLENLNLFSNEDEEGKEKATEINKTILAEKVCKKEFSKEELNEIFRELGFLAYKEDSQNDLASEERSLASEAFQILEQYGVNTVNTFVFSLAILGVFDVNSEEFYQKSEEPHLNVDEKEGRKLQKYFDHFYRNRLSCKTQFQSPNISSHYNSVSPSEPYISPRHSKNTQKLAEKYRSKMVDRTNQRFIFHNINIQLPHETMIAHEDLLVIDSLGRSLELKKIKDQKDTFLNEECTFYPKVNGNRIKTDCQTDRGMEKSMELYQLAKNKKSISHEKSLCETERKINNNECIFDEIKRTNKENNNVGIGKIIDKKVKNKTNEKTFLSTNSQEYFKSTSKDVDKAITRMIEGRNLREAKNNFLARGELKSKKPSKKCNLIQNQFSHFTTIIPQKEPLLVIDVNMGDEIQQIQLFDGDEKRVKDIVENFCVSFDVDNDCKKELFELVQYEIWKLNMPEC